MFTQFLVCIDESRAGILQMLATVAALRVKSSSTVYDAQVLGQIAAIDAAAADVAVTVRFVWCRHGSKE